MSFRDIKNAARAIVHDTMKVAAKYFPPGSMSPADCVVRVHTKFEALAGELPGLIGAAERIQQKPALIFWHTDLNPERKARVFISETEGYFLDVIEEPDGPTRKAFVTPLSPGDLAALAEIVNDG